MEDQYGKTNNLYDLIISRYLPYWPLFAILVVISLSAAWAYGHFTTPVYEAKATIIIKDEKKGVDDSKMLEAMNSFDSKKIVENEIEVMQSRKLMQNVVDSLFLYAPVFNEGELKSSSAYTASPILIKLKNPERIPVISEKDPKKIFFDFNKDENLTEINGETYPMDKWMPFQNFGDIMFISNPNQIIFNNLPTFFTLNNPVLTSQYLLESLEVSATNKLSTVVNLAYRDPEPKRAENILNSLIEAYNTSIIDKRNLLANNTLSFIQERMVNVENDLNKLETQIQVYKSDKGAVDLSEQGRMYLQNVGDNDRQLSDIKLQLSVLDQVERYVISKNNASGIVPATLGLDDPILTQLLQRLYNSEMQYEKLKRTTAENNPILSTLENEIENIRPGILENIRSQRQNLNASLNNLNSNQGRYNSIINSIPMKERELVEINRQKAIKDNLFNYLLQKREEAALSYAPTEAESRIVDTAQASLYPVSPKKIILYLMAIFFAMSLGVLYVIIKEVLNNKILFRSQLENFSSIPVLAELPFIKNKENKIFPEGKEAQFLTDELRQLAARLGLYSRFFKKKKILITSNIAGEGKSFVSANLANSLASAGKKTVLLDMDFRNPRTTHSFKAIDKNGMINYLEDKVELNDILINSTDNPNLFFAPAGTTGGDHTTLLLNGKLEQLFKQLEDNFEYIIIDSAPISLVSDVNILAEYSDKNLLIVRHNYTPKQIIKRLDQSIKLKSLTNVSLVFNGVRKRGMVNNNFSYGYGYGQGYGYGVSSTK